MGDPVLTSVYVQIQCGLATVRSFVTADTFEERRRLLHIQPRAFSDQSRITHKWKWHQPDDDGVMLKDYTSERIETELPRSFLPHLDEGPAETWTWTHASETAVHFGYSYDTRMLRARGYVFWDYGRLANWGFFQSEWVPPDEDDGQDLLERELVMERGRSRKRRLVRKGAGGWWSEEDESHLTWDNYPVSDDDLWYSDETPSDLSPHRNQRP